MNILVVYDSTKPEQVISAAIVKSRYPQTTSLLTAGLNTAGITALINAIPATSQSRIFVIADVDAAPVNGELTPAQVTALNAKLDGQPGSDTACVVIPASSGTGSNAKAKTLLTWEALYFNETPPFIVVATGNKKFKTELSTGTATAGTVSTIEDTTTALVVDSLAGKFVEIIDGTGAGQVRKIATNSADTLTVTEPFGVAPDATSVYLIYGYQISEVLLQPSVTASAGGAATITNGAASYVVNALTGAVVLITAGTGAGQFEIVASNTATVITVVKPWAVAPDNTSVFEVVSYDFQNQVEEISIVSGTATAGGATTITDTTETFVVNQLTGFFVRITGGTGAGQTRVIASNTATAITVSQAWAVNPNNTSTYEVFSFQSPWPFEFADQEYLLAVNAIYSDLAVFNSIKSLKEALGTESPNEQVNNLINPETSLRILSQGRTARKALAPNGLA